MPSASRRGASKSRRFPEPLSEDLLAAKRAISGALRTKFEADGTTITEFAKKLGTNRTAVRRILDERNTSISLRTMFKALSAAGLKLNVTAKPLSPEEIGALAANLPDASEKDAARIMQQISEGFYAEPDCGTANALRHAQDPA